MSTKATHPTHSTPSKHEPKAPEPKPAPKSPKAEAPPEAPTVTPQPGDQQAEDGQPGHESYTETPRWHQHSEGPPTQADGSREHGYVLWLVGEDTVYLTSWDKPVPDWRAWVAIPKARPDGKYQPFERPGVIRIPFGEEGSVRGQLQPDQQTVEAQ